MRIEHLTTPDPVELFVEVRSGDVHVATADTDVTEIRLDGDSADDVRVDHDDMRISVTQPDRSGFFGGSRGRVRVSIVCPADSALVSRLGSADLDALGRLRALDVRVGSGAVAVEEVAGDASVKAGSGGVRVTRVGGALLLRCGSGHVEVRELGGDGEITSGSGDVRVGRAGGALRVKSGSGHAVVDQAEGDVSLASGSGDLVVGRVGGAAVSGKTASGDFRVGIPAGTPTWTDLTTITGRIRSGLSPTGAPAEGQGHVEVRASTVSGDITLEEL